MKLMGYDFEIVYKKGRENVTADAFSRRPNLATISSVKSDLLEKIQKNWEEDTELNQLISTITAESSR